MSKFPDDYRMTPEEIEEMKIIKSDMVKKLIYKVVNMLWLD